MVATQVAVVEVPVGELFLQHLGFVWPQPGFLEESVVTSLEETADVANHPDMAVDRRSVDCVGGERMNVMRDGLNTWEAGTAPPTF